MAPLPLIEPVTATGWGLLTRRARWGLSLRGWLLFLSVAAVAVAVYTSQVHSFLAVTDRKPADVLAVEGWIQPYAIAAAVAEFNSGHYTRIVTTGGPVEGLGGYVSDYATTANVAAGRLREAGIPAARVAMAPSRTTNRDRTFASAVALREWLRTHAPDVRRINVVTADMHARRTRLLFALALQGRCEVGVIAVPSPDYDAAHWWRFSEGVRSVLGETISYLYAKFIFFPDPIPEHSTRP